MKVEYTVRYNPSAAYNWSNAATPFGQRYEGDIADYNRYVDKANAHYRDAAPHEEKVSIYGAQISTHANILAGFAARRQAYENQAVRFFGRWESRATADSACINWSLDDSASDLCVTQRGEYKNQWDALDATVYWTALKEIYQLLRITQALSIKVTVRIEEGSEGYDIKPAVSYRD